VSIEDFGERPPSWLELESVKTMETAEAITSLSADTIRRIYPHYVVQLSDRRGGMQLKNILAIARGTARRA
jgi:hypothetical protein